MSEPLKVGIAGYGVVGKRRREYIDAHPHLQTVAVCDRTLDGATTLGDAARQYVSYHDLMENEELDILFVAMSNDIAADVTIAGLEKGCHVFCEKPPGRDLSDIARVIAMEKKHPGQKLKYGFNHRYHNSIRDALEIVRSGQMGRIINLRGIYGKSQLISYGQTTWRTKRELAGGGILLDQGIHMVDLLRLFAGEFADIHSFISNDFWNHDVEDNAYALMRAESGAVAILHSSATSWRHRFGLDVTLEKGSLALSGILSGSKSYGAETLTIAWAEDDTGDPREDFRSYKQDPSWADEVNEFADAVLSDSPILNGSSNEAFSTMQLVYRIYCADQDWRDKWGILDRTPNL